MCCAVLQVNCTTPTKQACLFELTSDPEERHDLGGSPEHASRVTALLKDIESARASAFNPYRGVPDPRACEAGTTRWSGFWGPFAE